MTIMTTEVYLAIAPAPVNESLLDSEDSALSELSSQRDLQHSRWGNISVTFWNDSFQSVKDTENVSLVVRIVEALRQQCKMWWCGREVVKSSLNPDVKIAHVLDQNLDLKDPLEICLTWTIYTLLFFNNNLYLICYFHKKVKISC